MKTSRKTIATIAVVGTLAAVALFSVTTLGIKSINQTFLAQGNDTSSEVQEHFADFISKNQRSYLTKSEYNARLQIFK